ncbi:putative protein phosphatase 2C 8 [Acorus gramineus]|uniref:protein-serine/threonine phosphatase n=1 Tax=Acorus gramineus TaxID=55184 RepID=A0AAV9BJ80_ACOGR|nr:putative protein phosphatase 2C 8 [Acorus gramineus]
MAGEIEREKFKKAKSARRRRRRMQILRLRSDDLVEVESDDLSTSSSSPSSSSSSSMATLSSQSPLSDFETANLPAAIGTLTAGGDVPCFSHGSASVCGRRREMEDTVAVSPALIGGGASSETYDFFGVYDGHGGDAVAKACAEGLHLVLAAEVERRLRLAAAAPPEAAEEMWRKAIGECFAKVDEEVVMKGSRAEAEAEGTVGSTAVVAVVGTRRIVVGNCGDSRAVLSRGGVAFPLSRDHKPNRPDELERVEAAGGRVINWDGYRILGVLATSRSIGDHYLKPYVTCEPEVTVTDRTIHDEFLILASDGLWDVVSNEDACAVTKRCLARRSAINGAASTEAAAVLVELALSRGSKDNISVIVVELKRICGGGEGH